MSTETPRSRESLASRLPIVALYALLGLLVGVIGSFTHRSRFAIGDVTIWYGIFVALACALAFAIGLRASARGRGVSVAFASGVVVGIAFIAIGISHSVVVLGDLVGMVWIVATPILVFGVAFWPKLPPKSDARDTGAGATPVSGRSGVRGYPGVEPPPAHFSAEEPKQ